MPKAPVTMHEFAIAEAKESAGIVLAQLKRLWLPIVLALVVSTAWLAMRGEPPQVKSGAELAACRADLRCWELENRQHSQSACRQVVGSSARNGFKWEVDGAEAWSTVWANQKAGTLLLSGDKVLFEDAVGAYKRMRYECLYDPGARRARLRGLAPEN